MELSPEYVYLILWIIAIGMIFNKDSYFKFIGALAMIYLSTTMAVEYVSLYQVDGKFIVMSFILSSAGIVGAFKVWFGSKKKKKD